jgi:endonuclease IV
MINLGVHVSKGTDLVANIQRFKSEIPVKAIQIMTHGPRNKKKHDINYIAVANACRGTNIYVHSSYMTNPWNKNRETMIHTLDQFQSSRELGSKGVVIHIPKITVDEVITGVLRLLSEMKMNNIQGQKIILEMKAVKQHPTMSYESPEKINILIEKLIAHNVSPNDVGICIDTAHIYASQANIVSYEDGKRYLQSIVNPAWIALFHLNGNMYDSKKRAGDKHAIPLDASDCIWGKKIYRHTGCRAFIEYSNQYGIDCIVELKESHTIEQLKVFASKCH